MVDRLSKDRRSWLMSRVPPKNTTRELVVRRLAHAMGFRFRLHRRDLPGSPDLVFVSRRCVVFVHGCFWHRHSGCRKASTPKSNTAFWINKFERNVNRDHAAQGMLKAAGWRVCTIWECQTKDEGAIRRRLHRFLFSVSTEGSSGRREPR
jgi:DNA mismatch endonuclease, patch repair protein